MLKLLALNIINRIFGLKLSLSDLDAFMGLIELLIGAFGGVKEAVTYSEEMVRVGRFDLEKVEAAFRGAEQVLKK